MVAISGRTSVADASKKHKVSEPTIRARRKHLGQLHVADVGWRSC